MLQYLQKEKELKKKKLLFGALELKSRSTFPGSHQIVSRQQESLRFLFYWNKEKGKAFHQLFTKNLD